MPDVIVVGAGVVGASVAWHLARLGVRATLVEREAAPGLGSTGRATGGFRAQFGTAINVRLSLLSREDLRRGYLRGANVRTGAAVTALRRRGDRIEAVRLSDGTELAADVVVDAAGPWAGPVARLAGVEIPVAPLRRQVGSTVDTAVLPASMPMTIWVEDGLHIRPRDGRLLLVWPT